MNIETKISIFGLVAAVILCGCLKAAPAAPGNKPPLHMEIELAPYMGNLQRYSQKLGLSIEAKNTKLATFYLTEIEEVLDDVENAGIIEDGIPISETATKIMPPLLAPLNQSLSKRDWRRAARNYEKLIDGCNRCHAATEHEYIKIVPGKGGAPFNQEFGG